jgi:hypothetical protein
MGEDDDDDDDGEKIELDVEKIATTEHHKCIEDHPKKVAMLLEMKKAAQDELNDTIKEYAERKLDRRKLEVAVVRARNLEELSKDLKNNSVSRIQDIKYDLQMADYENRVAEYSVGPPEGKVYALWTLKEICSHRGLDTQAKWDELKRATNMHVKNKHAIPMANLGIKGHPHNKEAGFAAYMGAGEDMPTYVKRIQRALGWVESVSPVAAPISSKKRRRDELAAALALLEEESSEGEQDSDHERSNKRAKVMQTTDLLVVCKAKQIEKTK